MAVQGSIGTTLKVVLGAPATYDEAGVDTIEATATAVGELISSGAYGGSGTVFTRTPVGTGIVDKAIGSFDYGQKALTLTRDLSDAGQQALKDGFDGANRRKQHTFIVTFDDGTRQAFTGKISSFTTEGYSADSFIGAACNVELDDKVLELSAAP